MRLFNRPDRTGRLLKAFRTNFLFLISDGAYPPHRQQRLYQWCQKVGLDWAQARAYVVPEATAFLQSVIQRSVNDGVIAPEGISPLCSSARCDIIRSALSLRLPRTSASVRERDWHTWAK